MDLVKGRTSDAKYATGLIQPIQMLKKEDKTEAWAKRSVDWFEQLGIKQLKSKYERIVKNYKLARGIVDKTDYIKNTENEYNNVISSLLSEGENTDALSLDNFPIITNVINVLMGEFAKAPQNISVEAVDAFTQNEKLNAKYEEVKTYATQKAKAKLLNALIQDGYQIKSQEEYAEIEKQINEQVKSLPEIQETYRKNYRTSVEQWAQHQLKIDESRFDMYELEQQAFYDYLVTDSEYWHIDLREDDYKVSIWPPDKTFCLKSPQTKYVSESDCVGTVWMMTISDVIDSFGYLMTEEQILSLERILVNTGTLMPLQAGSQNTDYYDTSRPYSDQTPNSVNLHKLLASDPEGYLSRNQSFFEWINTGVTSSPFDKGMVRVTQLYWKSQRRVAKLTEVLEDGTLETSIVTEEYEVTQEPVYDLSYIKEKNAESLIFGQHLEWFWINQVYGCKKINHALYSNYGSSNNAHQPIYLDLGPIKFQFKGEGNLWGNKIPVEGITCTDVRLNKPFSPVDLMKPYQIIHNLVNNQIKDLLIDEIGTVILLDQNYLPTSSMGEDWGQNNLSKAYVAMKNFQMLPVDSTMANLGDRNSFSHFQQLNLEQTNRFISRLKIAEWSKFEAFAAIGISPQRLGAVTPSESATGTNVALENSYTQTTSLLVNHSNFIMPRVKNMMIEAAQFYNSSKPSVQLQYTTEDNENIMFELDGYKLLPRDINVKANYKPNTKAVLEQMKRLVMENNTTGATIYDLLKITTLNTPSEVIEAAKESVEQFQAQEQIKRDHEQQMLDKQLKATAEQREKEIAMEREENQLERENNLDEATIKALGFAKDNDINQDAIPDVLEIEKLKMSGNQIQQKLNIERDKLNQNANQKTREYMMKQKELLSNELMKDKELRVRKEISDNTLKVAKENKPTKK